MKCEACGRENPPDARYCRGCGKPLAEPEQASAAGKRFCPKCGAANSEGVAFCMQCGASMRVSARNEAPGLSAAAMGGKPSDADPQRLSPAITVQGEPKPPPPPCPTPTKSATPADSNKPQDRMPGQATDSPARKTSAPLLIVAGLLMVAVIAGGTYLLTAGDTPATPPAGAPETRQASVEPPASPETKTSDLVSIPEADRSEAQPSPVEVRESVEHVQPPPTQPTKDLNGQSPSDVVAPAATVSRAADNLGVATPPVQSPSARESKTQPARESTAAQASTPVPQRTAPTENTETDWRGLLARDIDKCAGKGLFDRVVCTERARWKYCHPDRWGKFTECPNAASDQQY